MGKSLTQGFCCKICIIFILVTTVLVVLTGRLFIDPEKVA